MTFDNIMEEIELTRYLINTTYTVGQKGYNPVNMLKTILFGFMDKGYISLRELEDECKVNIRYMYLMEYETPSYKTFGNFINENLTDSVEAIFKEIMSHIAREDKVDLDHVYIDGSKFEENANKYTFRFIGAVHDIAKLCVTADPLVIHSVEHGHKNIGVIVDFHLGFSSVITVQSADVLREGTLP